MAAKTILASAQPTAFTSNANGRASTLSTKAQSTPIPLTTIYTPPASCSSIVTWDGTHLWQYGTNQTGGDCYPPDFQNIFNSYFTPGICPDAWTSAGSVPHKTGFDAMCCPNSFVLSAHPGGYECASLYTGVLSNVYSTFEAGNDPIPKGASLTTRPAAKQGVGTVTADAIQVQWQARDQKIISLLSAKSSASKTSSKDPKSGARQTAPTAAPTVNSSSSDQSSGGLSTGAKIGIGVAIPLVVLALIGVGIFLFLRRRKTRGNRHDELRAEVEAKPAAAGIPAQYLHNNQQNGPPKERPLQEMDAHTFNELPAETPPAEISGQEMQRSSPYKDYTNRDSQYKDPSLQAELPETPTKRILR